MTLTKFEINDICNVVLDPLYVRLEKSNKLLERIAVALEQENNTINLLSKTEKEFLNEV
jgi:rubrerythrin